MASFTLSTFICIALLSCISWAEAGYSCPTGWVYFNGRCFKYFPTKTTWINAEIHCVSLGGNLASERCPKDHHFLKILQKRSDDGDIPFWIGLSDLHKEGTWIWSDGNPLQFTKWNPHEPSNSLNNEHCAHSNFGVNMDWNDAPCDNKFPYICAMRFIIDFALH